MTARASRIGYLQFMASAPSPPHGVVVISGKERTLADEVLQRIVSTTLPDESLRPLNLDALDALQTADFSTLEERLNTLPFLAQQRVVVVRNAVELRNDERVALRDAIPEVGGHAVLVVDDAGEPKPQRGKAPKDKVDSAGFIRTSGLVVECALDAGERERYIEGYAGQLGASVDAGARRYLADIDISVAEIRNALERLSLVSKKISRSAAEEYVKPPGDPKLWDLGNAIARGDATAALRAAREQDGWPDNVVGPLIWMAGDAQVVWELASGANPRSWAAATGQSAFRAMKLWDFARKRSPKVARDNVRLTMKALEDSMTGYRAGDQALDEVIVRLCTQK